MQLIPAPEVVTLETVMDDHHPILINVDSKRISTPMKELCAKGPSFVPTPLNYDWLQLQKDFDSFRNRIRARYIFRNKNSNNNDTSNIEIKNPPRKPSAWIAPKTNSPELETFISNIERSLFNDNSRRTVKDNLTKDQRM